MDPDYESTSASAIVESEDGIEVPIMTLDGILDENNISPGEAVLKVDCEGCEYDDSTYK